MLLIRMHKLCVLGGMTAISWRMRVSKRLKHVAGTHPAELKGDSDESGRRLIIEKEGRPIGEMNYKNKETISLKLELKFVIFLYRIMEVERFYSVC